MDNTGLNTNSIAFIGLCNEYCISIENVKETDKQEFVDNMLRLLPRIYISATDLQIDLPGEEDQFVENFLDEDYYDALRRNMEALMGEDDVYLEVFEEDMKYSDTPVAASISEGLADLFQVLYNFINSIRDTTDDTVKLALINIREDFQSYWSAILCNVLRALNHIKMN